VNLTCLGSIQGGNLYECRDCGLTTRETMVEKRLPCPYCGAQCVKDGKCKARGGTKAQRYLCRGCGHHSSELYPADRLEDLGGYLYRVRLTLDLGAQVGLDAVCQKFRMRETEAVRAVFRASRLVPLGAVERSRFDSELAARRPGESEKQARARVLKRAGLAVDAAGVEVRRLPDARSEATRARLAGRPVWEACGRRTVDVRHTVSVALDRTALAGLLRAMEHLGTRNRQAAARFLLADALSRFGALVVVPPLRGVRVGIRG